MKTRIARSVILSGAKDLTHEARITLIIKNIPLLYARSLTLFGMT